MFKGDTNALHYSRARLRRQHARGLDFSQEGVDRQIGEFCQKRIRSRPVKFEGVFWWQMNGKKWGATRDSSRSNARSPSNWCNLSHPFFRGKLPLLKSTTEKLVPSLQQSWKLTGGFWKTIFLLGNPFVHFHDCWKEGTNFFPLYWFGPRHFFFGVHF